MVFRFVKVDMLLKGLTTTELARMIGYSKSHVSGVINGHSSSVKVREAIALALNESVELLWTTESSTNPDPS